MDNDEIVKTLKMIDRGFKQEIASLRAENARLREGATRAKEAVFMALGQPKGEWNKNRMLWLDRIHTYLVHALNESEE